MFWFKKWVMETAMYHIVLTFLWYTKPCYTVYCFCEHQVWFLPKNTFLFLQSFFSKQHNTPK